MSRGITLTLLSAAALTACICVAPFGRRRQVDRTWYDAGGHAVTEHWKTDETGKRVPDPHPHDRDGRPWVYDSEGNLVPPPPPAGSSSSHRSGGMLWLWGGSGYRSFSGPSSPPRPSSGPSARPSSSSSAPRGGFGSTGSGISSSS
jgi:hypothetical protein